jgi:hypothetical protein
MPDDKFTSWQKVAQQRAKAEGVGKVPLRYRAARAGDKGPGASAKEHEASHQSAGNAHRDAAEGAPPAVAAAHYAAASAHLEAADAYRNKSRPAEAEAATKAAHAASAHAEKVDTNPHDRTPSREKLESAANTIAGDAYDKGDEAKRTGNPEHHAAAEKEHMAAADAFRKAGHEDLAKAHEDLAGEHKKSASPDVRKADADFVEKMREHSDNEMRAKYGQKPAKEGTPAAANTGAMTRQQAMDHHASQADFHQKQAKNPNLGARAQAEHAETAKAHKEAGKAQDSMSHEGRAEASAVADKKSQALETGSRGGTFYMSASGQKIYVKK